MIALSPRMRLRRRILRATFRLPAAVRARLLGPPPRNDRGDRLDPDIQWLLALERRFGPGISRGSVDSARARARTSAALVEGPRRPVDHIEDITVAGRPARAYHPGGRDLPVLLYLHGGGWVVGDLDTHGPLCRRLAVDTGHVVVALHYRRAPEHPFPAGLDDTVAALRELRTTATRVGGTPDHVVVGGDSAGGNLAAAACLVLRDAGEPLPRGQLLIYPATDLGKQTASHAHLAEGFLLERADIDWYEAQYGCTDADEVRVSVLRAPSHAGLPPAIVTTAGFDPLRDEGEAYADALRRDGVEVVELREPHLVHAYTSLDEVVPAADAAVARIADALRAWVR
ncbi:MAG: alpha/beta hydrolase [Alphaproteobacteria bacterium]|nr:alpha/beta hydrolase [Alphaproteobacteria bacterium]